MSEAPAGIYRLVLSLDGEVHSRDAKLIPQGGQLKAVEATVPFRRGLFGASHEIEIRVEFEPAVVPVGEAQNLDSGPASSAADQSRESAPSKDVS